MEFKKVRHEMAFGNLWKSADDIAAATGIDKNRVIAEIDAIKKTTRIATRATERGYEYAMAARIP